MTLYVDAAAPTQYFYLNSANLALGAYVFTLTSQYSKQPVEIACTAQITNNRYTKFEIVFPTGFADEHKNGVYYYNVRQGDLMPFTHGLVKIITEPGGGMGTVTYDSGVETENREADVYYRPNY